MSSELLASGVDNLKGNLAGAFNMLTGSSGDYTDLGIGRKFGGAAAAYSLRDVGAMNGPVVRVRRDSDNSEQDFSALAVPFIADWCNRQVVKPLDVRELVSGGSDDGRTGNFVIAKAAYSLRSLGDRQATVAATGDTVARADGKYVIQVRRSSDDTIKSFTADEVTDGTLVAFVGSGNDGFVRAWYDQSVSDQGSTATGNHAVQGTPGSQPKIVDSGSLVSLGVDFTGGKFMPFTSISAKTVAAVNQLTDTTNFNYLVGRSGGGDGGVRTGFGDGTFSGADTASSATSDFNHAGGTTHLNGSQSSFLATNKNVYFGTATSGFALTALGTAFVFSSVSRSWRGKIAEVIIYDTDQTDNRGAFEANIAEHYSISGIPAEDNQVNGFVETWYDQSGNNRPLIQTTATNQPLIVENGVFLNGVKANEATSSTDMMHLRVSTDGTTANFGTDDWASGASSKLGLIYVGTVLEGPSPDQDAVVWGGGRGISGYQSGGVSLQVVKSGTDSWKIMNERQGLTPDRMSNSTSSDTDADVVWYGIADNRDFTVNVNGSGDTETQSADLDVREDQALSLFGAFGGSGGVSNGRSSKGVCKECFLYAGDNITEIPTVATKINQHYSIY